ncbi:JmjC domain-containing histone demethylation protein 1 [Botryosphaeria dothidea]
MAETDSAIKKARKRTARELDKALASPMRIKWGSYSTQFPLPPSANDDTYNFLQAIEKKSTYAVVDANVNADLMEHLRKLSKIEILDYYHTSPGGPSQQLSRPDVILVGSANDLKDRLGTEFRTPLLFRASKEHPNTPPTDGFGFKSFISSFVNQDQARVDVNDWTIQDEEDRTYKTTVAEMVTRLVAEADDDKDKHEPDQPEPVAPPLNFLDIQNRTGIQFRPWPIALQDLNNRIASQQQNSALMWVGKSFASQPHSHQEFFIASTRNCITPTHVDTGGANTWVAVLEGRKIWFFPRSSLVDHAAAVQWLGVAGSLEPESLDAGGWAKVELKAGDILVMPPSFPHAVFTPDPTLVVGGQFYTAANLGRTVHGVALQERAPAVSNEDLAANTYETLAGLLDHCDAFLDARETARVRAHALSFFRPRDIHGDGAVGGPAPTRSQLKKRAERLGLQTRVNIPTAELAKLLRNQDPEKEHAEGSAGAGAMRQVFLKALMDFSKRVMPVQE